MARLHSRLHSGQSLCSGRLELLSGVVLSRGGREAVALASSFLSLLRFFAQDNCMCAAPNYRYHLRHHSWAPSAHCEHRAGAYDRRLTVTHAAAQRAANIDSYLLVAVVSSTSHDECHRTHSVPLCSGAHTSCANAHISFPFLLALRKAANETD